MTSIPYIRKAVIGTALGILVLASTASAQDQRREYREWQAAQQRAAKEHNDYLRSASTRDYRQWQAAERRAQEQYRQYQNATSSRYNNNDRYNHYSNGYSTTHRYRVYRNGSYYTTDYRGAELLRQAVQNGYSRGYNEGRRDRSNGRRYDYSAVNEYRSGSYGYQNYVDRSQYRYYFQQGFEKGYNDGYNSSYRYGTRAGNGFLVLGSVLNSILNLAAQ